MRTSSIAAGGLAAGVLLLTSALRAQAKPGQYVCTVKPAGSAEMWVIDPATRSAKQIQYADVGTTPNPLKSENVNCILMLNGTLGFVGTAGQAGTPPVPGNIYRITLTGSGTVAQPYKVIATRVNTTSLGSWVTQLVLDAGSLYAVCSETGATTTSLPISTIQKVPMGGGPATLVIDLVKVSGYPQGYLGVANCLAGNGKKLYTATWVPSELWEIDHKATTVTAKKVLSLPGHKFTPYTYGYPVHAAFHANGTTLGLASLGSELYLIDVSKATPTVAQIHEHSRMGLYRSTSTTHFYPSQSNSLAYNLDMGDWAMGGREGSLSVTLEVGGKGHQAPQVVTGIGTGAPARNSPSINGLAYIGKGGTSSYRPLGIGCQGPAAPFGATVTYLTGLTPTSLGLGAPAVGSAFSAGLDNVPVGAICVPFMGIQSTTPYPVDISGITGPGCFLRTDQLITLPGMLATGTGTATGPGVGKATIPFGTIPTGLTISGYSQWLVLDKSYTGKIGLRVSDARRITLK